MKTCIVASVALLSLVIPCQARGYWGANHPRRAQVIGREQRQVGQERRGFCQGRLTRGQEQRLLREDRGVWRQEQWDASRNGGHLTRAEQRNLNHEERRIQGQIHRDESNLR